MAQNVVVIYDGDYCFADRLSQYLLLAISGIEVHIATSHEVFAHLVQECTPDVILCSEDDPFVEQLDHVKVIQLTKDGCGDGLYKYQKASIIAERLKSCNTYSRKKIQGIYGVFSPCGGSGKTTFALIYGHLLAVERRVLYIGLDSYGSWESERGGLSHLYYAFMNGRDCRKAVESAVYRVGNLDCVTPVCHFKDLFDFQRTSIGQFLEWVRKESGYEIVIVDVGCLMEYTLELLSCMDYIFMTSWDKSENQIIDEVKKRVFRQYLAMEGRDDVWNKIKQVKMPYSKGINHHTDYVKRASKEAIGLYIEKTIACLHGGGNVHELTQG